MKAEFIKTLEDYRGDAHLYRLDPPIGYSNYLCDPDDETIEKILTTEFVVVSAVIAYMSGPETYIFPADAEGNVINWGELSGSYRGSLDHVQALKNAGYEVV